MATQRLDVDETAKDLVDELTLTPGQNYTLQIPPGAPMVEYAETDAAATDIPTARHYITPGMLFPFTAPSAGKAWVRGHAGLDSEVAVTEAP